jgi:hypothetical protein
MPAATTVAGCANNTATFQPLQPEGRGNKQPSRSQVPPSQTRVSPTITITEGIDMKTELHRLTNPRRLVAGFGLWPVSSLTRTPSTNPWWRKDAMADEAVKQAGVGERSTKPKATPRFLIGSPRSRVWSAAARQEPPAAFSHNNDTPWAGLGRGLCGRLVLNSSLDNFPPSGLALRDLQVSRNGVGLTEILRLVRVPGG